MSGRGQKPTKAQKQFAATLLKKLGLRQELGYKWGEPAEPTESNVGVQVKLDKSKQSVQSLNISGRPKPKHGASHGQHTTAFSANREVIVAATVGRSVADAKTNMAALFKTLLDYPAFTDSTQPEADANIIATIQKFSKPSVVKETPLEDLAIRYLEIRDSLPGASLNTGVDGTSKNARYGNTGGKAEPTTLHRLRELEEGVLKSPNKRVPDYAADTMLGLYDSGSEEGLDADDQTAQRRTFLLTIAQAFPALFGKAGAKVAQQLKQADPQVLQTAVDVAATLAKGNKLNSRPRASPLVVNITDDKVDIEGRYALTKDGDATGDHTCSELLMKAAASGLLLPDGEPPTGQKLAGSIDIITKQFDPEKYQIYLDTDEVTDDATLKMYQIRFDIFCEHHKRLSNLAASVRKTTATVGSDLVIEAAERYMMLIEERPTAVHFDAPANGRDEAGGKAVVEGYEKSDPKVKAPKDLLENVLKLIDCDAITRSVELFEERDKEDDTTFGDVVRSLIVGEFLFFVQHAYPKTYQFLETEFAPPLDSAMEDYIKKAPGLSGGNKKAKVENNAYVEPGKKRKWEEADADPADGVQTRSKKAKVSMD